MSRSLCRHFWIITIPIALAGCSHSEPAAVVPGVPVQVDRAPGPDTVVYARSISRDGQDLSNGTRTVVRRVIQGADGKRLLAVEQRFPAGGGEIVDTAIGDLNTMRAVSHRSHQPTRTMQFNFVGDTAVGTVMTAQGDTEPRVESVKQGLGGPIFDSNVLDLVVAALPLHPQYTTELPFFIFEKGGRVPMAVAVRERTSVQFSSLGQRDVWVVTVAVPGAPATVWVDTATHAVLRVRYDISDRKMSFTDERVTPLAG
jgi:hypothetical protein